MGWRAQGEQASGRGPGSRGHASEGIRPGPPGGRGEGGGPVWVSLTEGDRKWGGTDHTSFRRNSRCAHSDQWEKTGREAPWEV